MNNTKTFSGYAEKAQILREEAYIHLGIGLPELVEHLNKLSDEDYNLLYEVAPQAIKNAYKCAERLVPKKDFPFFTEVEPELTRLTSVIRPYLKTLGYDVSHFSVVPDEKSISIVLKPFTAEQ